MSNDSPIYLTRIECPVCQKTNEFEALKVGACVESGRDTDFRPLERRWRHPDYQHINPIAYSMATCVSCFYTRELDESYRNWTRDVTFKMVRQKVLREAHLKALAEPDGILRRLGEHLDLSRHPHATGINKLLLGIIDEGLGGGGDGLNVARFYLRIAWLFSEPGEIGEGGSTRPPNLAHLRRALQEHVSAGRRWLDSGRTLNDTLQGQRPPTEGARDPVTDIRERMERLFDLWQAYLLLAEDAGAVPAKNPGYFGFADHREFLASLRECSNDVPLSAQDAAALALRHYIHFFENGRSFARPEQEVQTAYLIGELGRRTHQADLAAGYFDFAIQKGRQLIHDFQKDPQRTQYLHKLVEMSIEQGKKNRDTQAVPV